MFGHLPKISQNYWPLKVSTCVQRVCVAVICRKQNASPLIRSLGQLLLFVQAAGPVLYVTGVSRRGTACKV